MAEVHIDDAERPIRWYRSSGPVPLGGPCPHDCQHFGLTEIGWGPDFEHYTLNHCDGCGCRGWMAEFPKEDRRRWFLHGFREVLA